MFGCIWNIASASKKVASGSGKRTGMSTFQTHVVTIIVVVMACYSFCTTLPAREFDSGKRINFEDSFGAVVCCGGNFGIRKFQNPGQQQITYAEDQEWNLLGTKLWVGSVLRSQACKECYFFLVNTEKGIKFHGKVILAKVDADGCREIWRTNTGIHVGNLEDEDVSAIVGSSIKGEVLHLFVLKQIDSTHRYEIHVHDLSAANGKHLKTHTIQSSATGYPYTTSLHDLAILTSSCFWNEAFVIRGIQYRRDNRSRGDRAWLMSCVVEQVDQEWKLTRVQSFSGISNVVPLLDGKFLGYRAVDVGNGSINVFDQVGNVIPWKSSVPDRLKRFDNIVYMSFDLDGSILIRGEFLGTMSFFAFKIDLAEGPPQLIEPTPFYYSKTDLDWPSDFNPNWNGVPFTIDGNVYCFGFDNVSNKYALERFVFDKPESQD